MSEWVNPRVEKYRTVDDKMLERHLILNRIIKYFTTIASFAFARFCHIGNSQQLNTLDSYMVRFMCMHIVIYYICVLLRVAVCICVCNVICFYFDVSQFQYIMCIMESVKLCSAKRTKQNITAEVSQFSSRMHSWSPIIPQEGKVDSKRNTSSSHNYQCVYV